MPEIPPRCIINLPITLRITKEEATAFVRTLMSKEQPGRIEFDVETRNRSNDFVCSSFHFRADSKFNYTQPAVQTMMPRRSALPAVLYPRQLFDFLLRLVSNSPQSYGDQCLDQLYFGFEVDRECHFLWWYFRLPFRSNSYYFLHGVAPFFLFSPI